MALQTCPAPPAPGECHRTVQFSPRVAFLWVAGKARAVGGASHCVLGSKAAGCGPPHPPTPPGPPPRGSAGVYRKCRTRLGGGWRGPGRCVLAWLEGLRAGPFSAPQGRGFLLLLKGKVPLPGQPCPSLASFLQDATPCRPPKPPTPTPTSPPLLPREAPGSKGKESPELGDSSPSALGLSLRTC